MRHTINILLGFWGVVSCPKAAAQFPTFPDSNAVWTMGVYDQLGLVDQYAYHLRGTDHDTIINGTLYNTVWGGVPSGSGGYCGGLREDPDSRVFYLPPNSVTEYLLYDFDPAVGDTMSVWVGDPIITGDPPLRTMYIDLVELYENEHGTEFRVVSIHALGLDTISTQQWIQGVGGTGGLFSTIGLLSLSPNTQLDCMQANDSIWPGGEPGNCWPTGIYTISLGYRIQCTTNPSSGVFKLSSPLPHRLVIHDGQGRLVREVQKGMDYIDLTGHPPGVYLAVLRDGATRYVQRLVVVRE